MAGVNRNMLRNQLMDSYPIVRVLLSFHGANILCF